MIRKNHILYNIKPNLINIYYIKKNTFKICTVKVRITPQKFLSNKIF